jgi:biotin operon repressor
MLRYDLTYEDVLRCYLKTNNRTATAKELGCNRRTIYNMLEDMRHCGVNIPTFNRELNVGILNKIVADSGVAGLPPLEILLKTYLETMNVNITAKLLKITKRQVADTIIYMRAKGVNIPFKNGKYDDVEINRFLDSFHRKKNIE